MTFDPLIDNESNKTTKINFDDIFYASQSNDESIGLVCWAMKIGRGSLIIYMYYNPWPPAGQHFS